MSNLGNKTIMARNIQHYMDAYNKTRRDICEAIGVKYTTLTDWVKGNSYPRIDKIEMMANYFGIEKSDLIEDKAQKELSGSKFSPNEIEHIEKYRSLDRFGQKAVNSILDIELERYQQFKQQIKPLPEAVNEDPDDYGDNVVLMPSLIQKICAGTGSIGDDIQLEEVPYPALRVPHGAKYAATISGDSMEPKYSDGDVIFFDDNPHPKLGDIVVMNINEENYIKKYTEDGFEALNQKYDTIVPGEDDHVAVYGKVLGKL